MFWTLRSFSCSVFNCSQTNLVAIILVLLVIFDVIFRLTNFSSDAFDFSSSKTGKIGSVKRALSALFSSVSSQTVLDTYTYTYGVKGGS